MASSAACCTCATMLSETKIPYDTESEKPVAFDRQVECCGRTICATCQYDNPRFQSYCPFCQISSAPSALPASGLRLPPSYSSSSRDDPLFGADSPPSYSSISFLSTAGSTPPETEDVVHYLNPEDSVSSIAISYRVPPPVLRSHNNVYNDGLLAGRKWILIPKSHYDGPPLSTPPDPDEEERKNKLRRWMITTKCADYDVATLYLKGSDYNLQLAVESFKADEQWEKDHPMNGKGKSRAAGRRRGGGTLSGQLF